MNRNEFCCETKATPRLRLGEDEGISILKFEISDSFAFSRPLRRPSSSASGRVGFLVCVIAVLAFALRPTMSHAEEAADDPNVDTSTWVTSIAPIGSTGQFVAGTANSLLLREASVVSFDPSTPSKLTTLYSHQAAVWCVATTFDGSSVASVDYRGNLVLFDMEKKKAVTHEGAFERWCQALTFSPDDQFVVAGNEAGKVLAWDVRSNEVSKSVELDGYAVTGLAFSPDGKRIAASAGDGHVHLLKWPDLESIGKIKISDQPAWCVAFTKGGKELLVGSGDRKLYRAAAKPDSKPVSIASGSDWITQLAVSPGGQVAAAEVGGKVLFPAAGGGVDSMDAQSGVWALRWQGDEKLLVGTRKHGIIAASRSWKWSAPEASSPDPSSTKPSSKKPSSKKPEVEADRE